MRRIGNNKAIENPEINHWEENIDNYVKARNRVYVSTNYVLRTSLHNSEYE